MDRGRVVALPAPSAYSEEARRLHGAKANSLRNKTADTETTTIVPCLWLDVQAEVMCKNQDEVDRYWDGLFEGGEKGPAGG